MDLEDLLGIQLQAPVYKIFIIDIMNPIIPGIIILVLFLIFSIIYVNRNKLSKLPFIKPTDCTVTEWVSTGCSTDCGCGTEKFVREVSQKPKWGGEKCPSLKETRSCQGTECPKECKYSEWSKWSNCTDNKRKRTRTILQGECDGELEQEDECTCEVGQWSEWSGCSKDCDTGEQVRTRVITSPGKDCPELKEIKECNTHECPQDCQVSHWSTYGPCIHGYQKKNRTIVKQSENGGSGCPHLEEIKSC